MMRVNHGQDETAGLSRSIAEMLAGLNAIIGSIGYVLNKAASQNSDTAVYSGIILLEPVLEKL